MRMKQSASRGTASPRTCVKTRECATDSVRYVLLILCLAAASLPAQQAEMIPPPIPSVIPPEPPDPDTLPPPQLEWEPASVLPAPCI